MVKRVLMLDDRKYRFRFSQRGIDIVGNGKGVLLNSWGDGYKSTFTWVLDFLGWAVYAKRIRKAKDLNDFRGIVLIDEVELNMHPLWQRSVVKILKEQFPNVQFIVTSHSPLIAAGAADFKEAKICVFRNENGGIKVIEDLPSIRGMRVDQVLTSLAFGLHTTISIGSVSDIKRFTELMSKKRDKDEEEEYKKLSVSIEKESTLGETKTEKLIEKAFDDALDNILEGALKKDVDLLKRAKIKNELKKIRG
jgi:predicted ATP-binding protein involved in virulence